MRICQNCGVELEDNMNYCPLCGHPVERESSPSGKHVEITANRESQKTAPDISRLNTLQMNKLIWEVSSIILLSGTIVVILLNLILNAKISWSVYPIIFGLSIFAYISVFTLWQKKTWTQIFGSLAITLLMLFFIDLANNTLQWFIPVALPLVVALYTIGVAIYIFSTKTKPRGFILIAYIFTGIAILMMVLEALLSYYQFNSINMEWSIIVLISIIPVAAILFYIHFRLKKNPDLKKIFHI